MSLASRFRQTIASRWYPVSGESPSVPLWLRIVAVGYCLGVGIRNTLYDKNILQEHRLPCPVISIGNLTVGGTGKTPLVIFVARLLGEQGYRPAVLSRGYGRASQEAVLVVSDGNRILADEETAGDEPMLIARSLPGVPVLVGPERAGTGERAVRDYMANVLILDDAFQHRAVARDMNIVLIDGQRIFGNGQILPAGPLREPVSSMKRADIVVMTKTESGSLLPAAIDPIMRATGKDIPVFFSRHCPVSLRSSETALLPLQDIRGKTVCAFAGIAFPEALRLSLESLGAQVISFLAFPDHHRYTESDVSNILSQAARADLIVTTEKDGERLRRFPEIHSKIILLAIGTDWFGHEEAFCEALLSRISLWKKPDQPV